MQILWQLFGDAPYLMQGLSLLQLGFTVWMMVDAYHRRVEPFWYWIILLFQPLGAWGYFFAVKMRTLRLPGLKPFDAGEERLSLEQLRYRAERTPTVANRFALAQRLVQKGLHAEAMPHLDAVLEFEPDYCAALHALAECRLATGAAEQAVAPLERLMKRDFRWSNYRAYRTLIDVQLARKQPAEALMACREFEKHSPTFENKCLLAEMLLHDGGHAEARHLLERTLEDHSYAPWSARLRDWRWAREARRMLAEADKETK